MLLAKGVLRGGVNLEPTKTRESAGEMLESRCWYSVIVIIEGRMCASGMCAYPSHTVSLWSNSSGTQVLHDANARSPVAADTI